MDDNPYRAPDRFDLPPRSLTFLGLSRWLTFGGLITLALAVFAIEEGRRLHLQVGDWIRIIILMIGLCGLLGLILGGIAWLVICLRSLLFLLIARPKQKDLPRKLRR